MLFSVIIPVYNVEKYLEECVNSILKQTFKDYEIILVDDGSKDKSPEICDSFEKEYSNINVIHKSNGGASDSRNAGLITAKGEYVIYIDSDDFIIEADFLQKIAEKAKSKPDQIFFKYKKYFDSTLKFEQCKFSYKNVIEKKDFSHKIQSLVEADAFYGMAWIRAIRRSLLVDNNIMFEVGLVGEDMDWNYQVICHSKSIELIDEALVAYRQRSGSVTSNYRIKNLQDFIIILEKWSDYVKNNISDKVLQKALFGSLAKYYSNLLIIYARMSDGQKKGSKQRIKNLKWLLKYSMSHRPCLVYKSLRIIGFNMTIITLKIMDKLKKK